MKCLLDETSYVSTLGVPSITGFNFASTAGKAVVLNLSALFRSSQMLIPRTYRGVASMKDYRKPACFRSRGSISLSKRAVNSFSLPDLT